MSLYPNTGSRMGGGLPPTPGRERPIPKVLVGGMKGSGECRGWVLASPCPPVGPVPARRGESPPPQWSPKPGMGKARAKVSTRWRRSAKRRCVSASCSKKVLNSWSLPGGGGRGGMAGERGGGHASSPRPAQSLHPKWRGADGHPGRAGAPAPSPVLLLTSRARAMPSSMKATTFRKSSSWKWREVSAGAPGGWSPSGPGAAQGHQPQKPIPPRGSPIPSPLSEPETGSKSPQRLLREG